MTSPIDVTNSPRRLPGDGQIGVNYLPGLRAQNPLRSFGDHPGSGGVQVVVSGPIFNGMAAAALAAMLDEMAYTVAAQGLANVQYNLDRSIRHPTPYYETQITLQRQANDVVVHDRGIVYGPWLEGVSERNRTTRFKGYHSFRRATDELRRQVPGLIGHIVQRTLGAIG